MTEAIVRLDTSATFASLLERIEALEEQVARLQSADREEVRTKRLVVVDEDGGERIVAQVIRGDTLLRLYYGARGLDDDFGDGTAIELSASMDADDDYMAAIALSSGASGDVMLEVLATQEHGCAPSSGVSTFQHFPES